MVNLRFHLVSLVAVFFALAIGIGVGSSVVRSGVLERTQSQLSTLDAKLSERNDALQRLRDERDTVKTLDTELDRRVLAGALSAVEVIVVGLPGAGASDVAQVVRVLEASKAKVAAWVALQPKILLRPGGDLRFTAIALESYSAAPSAVAVTLRERLRSALSDAPDGSRWRVKLRDQGFMVMRDAKGQVLDPGRFLVGREARIVVVGTVQQSDRSSALQTLRALAVDRVGGVVALDAPSFAAAHADASVEPTADAVTTTRAPAGTKASSLVEAIRANSPTRKTVVTIDGRFGADGTSGRIRRVALVLALLDASRNRVGHFGTSDTARSLVPPR